MTYLVIVAMANGGGTPKLDYRYVDAISDDDAARRAVGLAIQHGEQTVTYIVLSGAASVHVGPKEMKIP